MELEAKVLLSPEKYIELVLHGSFFGNRPRFKRDEYFTKYNSETIAKTQGESLTRIRTEGPKKYLTLKKKTVNEEGCEENVEIETQVSDISAITSLLMENGYRPYFEKEKRSIAAICSPVSIPEDIKANIELEIVKNSKKQLYALEIEILTEENNSSVRMKELKHLLDDLFLSFGFSEKDYEKRSWQELLK